MRRGPIPGIFFLKMEVEDIRKEILRRKSFVDDELIGQSPEDLERHYKLIGKRDAFVGLLKFIENEGVCI